MPERIELKVLQEDAGKRLDAWLAAQADLGLTRSAVQNLLEKGAIWRNGSTPKKNDRLAAGDLIAVEIPDPEPLDV